MLASALSALFPTIASAVVLGILGVAAGPFLTLLAARRTVEQPLALVLEDETKLLLGVLGDVRRLPYLTSVSGSDFAAGSYGRIWDALLACAPESEDLPEDAGEDQCEERGRALVARREEYLASVRALLAAGPAPAGDTSRFEELLTQKAVSPLDDAQVVESGAAVLYAGTDRNRLSGAGLVLPTATPDSADPAHPPLQRIYTKPSRSRHVVTSLLTGLTAAAAPGLVAASGLHALAAVLAVGAVLSLLALSVVISLVDLDTFYIDLRFFLITATLSWALTIAAAGAAGDWHRLLHGVFIVIGVAAVFEGGNKIYRLVRGTDGQGFGDTLIVLATAGIPPAIAGTWTLGYYSVMAGMVAGVVGWIVGFARGKLNRSTPFAFGPYLAAGWVIGWFCMVGLS